MFSEYQKSNGVLFKYARGLRDVTGKEFHAFNEIFLMKSDKAKFTSDSFIESIYLNTLIVIPKEKFHQFDPVGAEENYCRCVFQFDEVPGLDGLIGDVTDNVKIIHNISQDTQTLFEKAISLNKMKSASESDKKILLKSVFAQILFDLKYNYCTEDTICGNNNDTVSDIISYIENHYSEKITIKTISKDLNFSETLISHKFKEIMHISPHSYILKKKLTHACNLIKSGISPSDAAIMCGFGEYTGFYKMYKKYFGISPSETSKLK